MIKKIRFFVNSKLGFDVIKFNDHHNLRSHLYQILENFKIESIIDVGANEGQFGKFLREIGFQGKIFSFEPVN